MREDTAAGNVNRIGTRCHSPLTNLKGIFKLVTTFTPWVERIIKVFGIGLQLDVHAVSRLLDSIDDFQKKPRSITKFTTVLIASIVDR